MLRILLADDSAIVRQAIRRLLEQNPAFIICGEAGDGDQAISQARELRPDVMLLDLSLPGLRGQDVITALRSSDLSTRIIVISEQDQEVLRQLTRSFGISHAIAKSDLGEKLIPALNSLLI